MNWDGPRRPGQLVLYSLESGRPVSRAVYLNETLLSLAGTQKQQIKCTLHLDEQPNDRTRQCGMVHSYSSTTVAPTLTAHRTPEAEVVFG